MNYFERRYRLMQMQNEMNDQSLNPKGKDIFEKLKNAKTIPELNSLRIETTKEMLSRNDHAWFELVQKEFIKAKNRIKRMPA
jgi:hypothetical protein